MNRFVFVFTLVSTFCAFAQEESAPPVNDLKLAKNVPHTYTVVRGDTLWGISAKFLAEPWRWPEIWRMNKEQIKQPNRIYPGDVIILDYDGNQQPLLRLRRAAVSDSAASLETAAASGSADEASKPGTYSIRNHASSSSDIKLEPRIYSDQNGQSIPAIPQHIIDPFISTPQIVEASTLDNAALIVAATEDRVFLGKGDAVYVTGAHSETEFWQVYRDVKPLHDPENLDRVLAYEIYHLGTAKQIRLGDPATFEILSAKEEIGRNDRLLPSPHPPLVDYIPHKPDFPVEAKIVSVYGTPTFHAFGTGEMRSTAGMFSIVSLNRGSADGIEIGHVLAAYRNRVIFAYDKEHRRTALKPPPERSALMLVFRTFERISYALIVHAEGVIEINDFIRTP